VRTYLDVDAVAALLHMSGRQVRDHCRQRRMPHRRPAGTRRLLFDEDELAAWLDGASLEVVESPAGGRVVRSVPFNGAQAPAPSPARIAQTRIARE
jgi:hypothetical protein